MTRPNREILIVESNAPTAALYQRALSDDYLVTICTDPPTALELLRTRHITAIVLEPTVSDGQGWQLLVTIRTQHADRALPIVLCSTLDERRRGRALGADAYLLKPTLPATLRATLQQVIQRDTVDR